MLRLSRGGARLADVFISYSRANQKLVRQLAEAVKREGYDLWWDEELPPHLSYGDVITEKIGAAKAAIVVWSQDAAASEWVRAEADVARNQRKLIQTSIDDRMPPMPFNQIQFASIGDWRGEDDHPGWMKVKASLAALCGPARAPVIPAPPVPIAVPPPPPPHPSPPAAKGSALIPVLIGALLLAVLVVGYLIWSRGRDGNAPIAKRAAPSTPEQSIAAAPPAETERAPAEAEPEPDQIIPDSSRRRLSAVDIEGLSVEQLRTARNEIFARHGRIFRDPALQRHFRRHRWYRERAGEVALTEVEEANVRLLREAESW